MTDTMDLRDAIAEAATDTAGITAGSAPAPAVQLLALSRLHGDPRNRGGREIVDDERTRELADSIRENGLLQPMVVRPREDGDWSIVMGHRRRKACELAGLAAAPCIVRDVDDEQALVENLIENLHREDLTPLEEAAGLKALADLGLSQRQIAKRIGKTQPHVSRRLSMLELPEAVQQAFLDEVVTIEEARALRPLVDHPNLIADVLERKSRYDIDVDHAVTQHTASLERKAQTAEIRDRIRSEGKTWIEPSVVRGYPSKEINGYPLKDWGVKIAAHRRLPCHAYSVTDYGALKEIEVCSKPNDHKPGAQPSASVADGALVKETPAQKKARLAEEKRQQEEADRLARAQAARDERLAAVTAALTAKPTAKTDAALLDFVLAGVYQDLADCADLLLDENLELAGYTLTEAQLAEGLQLSEVADEQVLAKGRPAILRVVAAYMVGMADSKGAANLHPRGANTAKAYDAWLTAIGATPPERTS